MLDFTWRVFCMTGNIDTYLLLREMESEHDDLIDIDDWEALEDQPTQ
ncbi:YqzL-like protein [Scopulibacillus darangshiensis]|uniref:YqzL-like protein n=1 Tax=Scopulibacillus darangshiensis TaxID=442528 RepID=A0A4R2PE04_9BACL|nr:YqzL family protein [Scopulibacillus darangshiensis]TCP32351.1 YqzL-like protein [Scopulibacillus darangshiensis]